MQKWARILARACVFPEPGEKVERDHRLADFKFKVRGMVSPPARTVGRCCHRKEALANLFSSPLHR